MAEDNPKTASSVPNTLAFFDNAFDTNEQSLAHNTRVAVRYLRNDISLKLKRQSLLKWLTLPDVEILDISSKGAYISSSAQLKINQQFMLIIEFTDGKNYQIAGAVVYNHPENSFCYGIKFKNFEHELGDYLNDSQTKFNADHT